MVIIYRLNEKYCLSGKDPVYLPVDLEGSDVGSLPVVTVQLPIFNEFYVIDRLIETTVKLEWPKEKLEIQVLDDSTDESYEKARRSVEYYQAKGFDIQHIHRKNREGHSR